MNERPSVPRSRAVQGPQLRWGGALACFLLGCPTAPEPADPEEATPLVEEDSADDALQESPGNDRPERATVLRVGTSVRGDVTDTDVDYLRVVGGADGVRLTLRADASVQASILTPRDGAQRPLFAVAPDVREAELRSDAPVYVRLEGQGVWRIEASVAEFACGLAGEPDGGDTHGVELTSVPGRASGCLATPGDEDVVRVPASVLESEDAFGAWFDGVPGVSMQVVAVQDDGHVLFDLSGGPGEGLAIPSVRTPDEGGLTFRIRSLAGANDEHPWGLELRRLPALNGLIESEPNDTEATASIIDTVDIVNGWFHRPGDIDHYRIESLHERVLRMRVTPPEGTDVQISVSPTDSQSATIVDEGRAGVEEVLCSLRVGPERPFSFSLRARSSETRDPEPYVISFDLFDAEGFEIEPNDSLRAATELDERSLEPPQLVGFWIDAESPRLTASGHIFPRGDIDHFLVEVYQDPLASITFTSVTFRLDPNGPSAYNLEVLDVRGAVVARGTSRGPGEAVSIPLDLPGGRYWARVSLASGETCGPPYRLSLEQTAYPEPRMVDPRDESNEADPGAAEPPHVGDATPGEGSGQILFEREGDAQQGSASPPIQPLRPRPIPERERAVRPRPQPSDMDSIHVVPPADGPAPRTW